MITLRWAAFLIAVIAIVCALYAPTNPASHLIAGFLIATFTVTLWPFRKGSTNVDA